MAPFITRRRVEFAHTDQAGVAHFSEYFRYMESAEHEWFRAQGFSVCMEVDGRSISWPRVACGFDFKSPLRFEEEFEIHLSVDRLGESSVTWVAVFRKDGRDVATGRCTAVCCRIAAGGSMKRTPIPVNVREKLAVYMMHSQA